MPDPSPRAHLLGSASAMAEAAGLTGQLHKVTIELDDGSRIEVPAGPGERPQAAAPEPVPAVEGRLYSPFEVEVMTALAGRGRMRIEDLAVLMGYSPSSRFRTLIANMGEAGILDNNHRGVALRRK